MQNSHLNLITRRSFLGRSAKVGIAAAMSTLVDVPFVMKRALAEGNIGINGKKVLFIWLRGANDALNSVIPILDGQYSTSRPNLKIDRFNNSDAPYQALGGAFDPTVYANPGGVLRGTNDDTYSFANGIPLGNGFAAMHPSLKFLAPMYNVGDLALVHRVAYPRQSRSHFDSQRYWENGSPNNNIVNDGIFYRTIYASGLANSAPLTGVTIQSSLPLIMRGSAAAMTNLTDPTRYNLLGIPSPTGDVKADAAIATAGGYAFPPKLSRDLLSLQYKNLQQTLSLFASIDFSETGNTFRDDIKTDGDTDWYPQGGSNDSSGYYLFPTNSEKNGGWRRPNGAAVFNKYAVPTGLHGFFNQLKSAALVLNRTDAMIAGTEFGGFDTHVAQGAVTGSHPNLNRGIGWAMYALRKFFKTYGKGGTQPMPGATTSWDDLVVITLSEFGRTTVENGDIGTDHAEAGVMFVAGGKVNGYGKVVSGSPRTSGVFNCHPNEFGAGGNSTFLNWFNSSSTSAMLGVSNGYLRRNTDYRSVLGEIIRKHMGATQGQLNTIIPGYATDGEKLLAGGVSSADGTNIRGEVGFL